MIDLDWLKVRWAAQLGLFDDGRLIVWYSHGAASACALKLVSHLNPLAVYCNTSQNEHPDNTIFMGDVEEWTGIKITTICSEIYQTVEQVFDARNYMSGRDGAPCTVALKKVPRFMFQRVSDVHCFGYTVEEKKRIADFEHDNFDLNLAWPLQQREMTKDDCFAMVEEAGIELPMMYKLGYRNNNCIGCVKAQSPSYWNRVRRQFPDVFKSRCEQSRRMGKVGCKLVRLHGERIFLDKLPPDEEEDLQEDLSCGPQCNGMRDESYDEPEIVAGCVAASGREN